MILAIDAGNTNIVLGAVENGQVLFTGRVTTRPYKTGDEYAVLFREIASLHGVDIAGMEGASISSVVPALTDSLVGAATLLTGKPPVVVGTDIHTGIVNRMEHPQRTGSDLIANCAAAAKRYPLPLVVIDLGTATTLSLVNGNSEYAGNVILPGVALSLEALAEKTAQLPRIRLEAPGRVAARNTEESMRSGLLYGNAAMLDGMLDRMEEELGQPLTAVATGGLAPQILPHCRREIIYNPHLLLLGLEDLYHRNR